MAALSMPPLRGRKKPAWNGVTRRRREQTSEKQRAPCSARSTCKPRPGPTTKHAGVRAPAGEEKDTCAPSLWILEGGPFTAESGQGWFSTVRHRRAQRPNQREGVSWARASRQEPTRTQRQSQKPRAPFGPWLRQTKLPTESQ